MHSPQFQKLAPPALPQAGGEYDRPYQDQLNNVQRLFFNRLTSLVNQLAGAVTTLQDQVTQFAVALPAPSADYRGVFMYLDNGPGVADAVYVCTKDAGGAYTWKLVA